MISRRLFPFYLFYFFVAAYLCEKNPALAAEGISFDNEYVHPGKLDFLYFHEKGADGYNLQWWSPVFIGGLGLIESNDNENTEYIGSYICPLRPKEDKGELILGFLQVDKPSWPAPVLILVDI